MRSFDTLSPLWRSVHLRWFPGRDCIRWNSAPSRVVMPTCVLSLRLSQKVRPHDTDLQLYRQTSIQSKPWVHGGDIQQCSPQKIQILKARIAIYVASISKMIVNCILYEAGGIQYPSNHKIRNATGHPAVQWLYDDLTCTKLTFDVMKIINMVRDKLCKSSKLKLSYSFDRFRITIMWKNLDN